MPNDCSDNQVMCLGLGSVQIFCNTMDHSLPGSCVHGILKGRILEFISISSSTGSSQPRDQTRIAYVSCIAGRYFTHWSHFKLLVFVWSKKVFYKIHM